MADISSSVVRGKSCGPAHFATRAATGKARHAQRIDARTLWGRRDREIYNAIISDLGGVEGLSELEHQVVRRAVGLALRCEQFETELAEGKAVDIGETATLINTFNRTASLLGLKRRSRDVTPTLHDLYIDHDSGAK